jgi:hypothetical protein
VRDPENTPPDPLTQAAILRDYKLSEILELKFTATDKYHQGTIRQCVLTYAGQLRNYIRSPEVTQRVLSEGLEMRAHLVIIVGSRHILLWDMDKDGNLADKPRLVGMPSTWNTDK